MALAKHKRRILGLQIFVKSQAPEKMIIEFWGQNGRYTQNIVLGCWVKKTLRNFLQFLFPVLNTYGNEYDRTGWISRCRWSSTVCVSFMTLPVKHTAQILRHTITTECFKPNLIILRLVFKLHKYWHLSNIKGHVPRVIFQRAAPERVKSTSRDSQRIKSFF